MRHGQEMKSRGMFHYVYSSSCDLCFLGVFFSIMITINYSYTFQKHMDNIHNDTLDIYN